MMKTLGYLFLGSLGALMFVEQAFAYVPSSYFITQSWVSLQGSEFRGQRPQH